MLSNSIESHRKRKRGEKNKKIQVFLITGHPSVPPQYTPGHSTVMTVGCAL